MHFYLPPEWGTARGGALQLGPQKECSPCNPGQVGVLAGGGHGGTSRLRSVSVEPLQNTKLGTPGAPQPGALAPPLPPPRKAILGGWTGRGCPRVARPRHGAPPWPIYLSPHRPPPCLALGNVSPTTTPPRPRPKPWPWAGPPPASSAPSLPPPPPYPQARPASPHLQKPDFPPRPAQGAWRTHLIIKRKTQDPSPLPLLLLSRGVQGPLVLLSVPRAPPPGGRWGPKHGPLFGRAGGVGFAAGVSRSFSAGNRRVRAGGEGGGARQPPAT